MAARPGLTAFLAAIGAILRDLAGIAGAGLTAWGAWLIYPPAGFIVAGVLLMAGATLLARGD